MRVVADTNIIVSGLMWDGPPRRVLEAASAGQISLFTSPALLAELEDVLGREKFALRLARVGRTARDLVERYALLAESIDAPGIDPVILADPDDDVVLACALAAGAARIVSGDHHLLELKDYRQILIVTAVQLLDEIHD
jgi:putative PIN family toxin of toxin-antitoxin system